MQYWVVGGEYEDTRFQRVRGAEERHGPFASYAEAEREWRRRTMAQIDNALVRFTIAEHRAAA